MRAAFEIWEALVKEFPADADYHHGLAINYGNQGYHLTVQQRDPAKAETALRQAEALFSGLLKERPGDYRDRLGLGRTLAFLANWLTEMHRYADAEAANRQAVVLFEGLTVNFPDIPEYRESLATAQKNLGLNLHSQMKTQR